MMAFAILSTQGTRMLPSAIILGASIVKRASCMSMMFEPIDYDIKSLRKGSTGFSWFFEQNVYYTDGIVRAIKSTDGSGNIPKVILTYD